MDQDQTRPDDQGQAAPTPGAGAPGATPDPHDPYSRRRFLRAAVIGAAGVAGAAGAAGVVLAHGQLPAVVGLTGNTPAVSFHDPGCSGCMTDSGFLASVGNTCGVTATGITVISAGHTSPGDFYVTFTAPSLPAGSYYATFTPDSNFDYKGTSPYYKELFAAGTAQCCPTSGPGSDNGASLDAIHLSSAHPTVLASSQDIVLHVHMHYVGPALTSSTTFHFSATFYKSGQTPAVCSESISVTGHP